MDATSGPGEQVLRWDGRDERGRLVTSGVYFVVFETEGLEGRKKMVCLR